MSDLLEHVFGEHVRIRTAHAGHESLEFADQMRPAQLPQPVLVVVGSVVIGSDYPLEGIAQ